MRDLLRGWQEEAARCRARAAALRTSREQVTKTPPASLWISAAGN